MPPDHGPGLLRGAAYRPQNRETAGNRWPRCHDAQSSRQRIHALGRGVHDRRRSIVSRRLGVEQPTCHARGDTATTIGPARTRPAASSVSPVADRRANALLWYRPNRECLPAGDTRRGMERLPSDGRWRLEDSPEPPARSRAPQEHYPGRAASYSGCKCEERALKASDPFWGGWATGSGGLVSMLATLSVYVES